MAINEYDFHYVPAEGKLSGLQFQKQTEDALNDMGNRIITGAEADSAEALEKANTAIEDSASAVETANDAEQIAQDAYDYITGEFPKVHFVGVNSTASSDANYTGGGATGTDAIAVGVSASATGTNSVAIGTGSVSSNENEVSVGNDDTKRKIVNVAEGSGNNDAMTYGQGVDRTSAQTISGVKTFSNSPLLSAALSTNDNSEKAANTKYVKECVPANVGSNTVPTYTDSNGVLKASNKSLTPVNIDETEDEGEYYDCTVPSNKVFSNFSSIGGKTVAWNQLVDSGTSSVTTISGHKYYTLINGSASIVTSSGSAISVTGGTDKVTDLTLAFGSGNEPSVADFQALFPNYASMTYNAGTLLSASIDKVISKDSSNNTIATMPIPSAIQSLTGYGWSAGTAKNYIDFTRKKYVQQVGSVDLGSLSWEYVPSWGTGGSVFVNHDNYLPSGGPTTVQNMICAKYVTVSRDTAYNSADDAIFGTSVGYKDITIRDIDYSDAAIFKSAMSGVMLYYELATPIETDISVILGATGIACASGGSLTFSNSNGTNYKLPVPVSMDYVADADGFITAQDKEKIEVAYERANTDDTTLLPTEILQRNGTSVTLSGIWTVVWNSATVGILAISFPFIAKNTNYSVIINSLNIEGIGAISLSNISVAGKYNAGCKLSVTSNGTVGQSRSTYSTSFTITFA